MTWTNRPLIVYHGTHAQAAEAIVQPAGNGEHSVDLSLCRARVDFGRGFYVTTSLDQAKNWANVQARGMRRSGARAKRGESAAVVRFRLDRNRLAELRDLVFMSESQGTGFWDFIHYCRREAAPLHGTPQPYDIVYGPLTLWPQRLVLKDCDQIGFHTERALAVLQSPEIAFRGSPLFEL